MPSVFFYTICIGFASGIFFRSLFDFGIGAIGVVLVASGACMLVWRRKAADFATPLFVVGIFFIACAVGMFRMDGAERKVSQLSQYVGNEVVFVGEVVREPEARAQNIHVYITPIIDDVPLDERVLVTLDRFAYANTDIQYGNIVRVTGELTLPEAFETDGGRTFDYPGYLKAQKVNSVVYRGEIEIVNKGEGTFFKTLYSGKQKFMESLEYSLPQPHAGLGEGVLLGVKRALSETLDEAFRKTGTIHIVVLSGYNVLIVIETLMYVLAYVFRRRTRVLFGIFGIIIFALLVGMSATVVRASIMAGLLLVARGTGRTYAVLRGLGLAGVVMLAINPYLLLHDPGFQLSFLATLGLILFTPYIEKKLLRIPEGFGMRGIVTATIATQIMVLPLLLYHTGMLSAVSVIVNALVLPMVPIAMLLTLLTGMFGLFSTLLGTVFGYVAYLSLGYIIGVVTWFAGLPFSATTVNAFPFWIVVIAYVAIGILYVMRWQNEEFLKEVPAATNEYEGWVIEEDNEILDNTTSLPFR